MKKSSKSPFTLLEILACIAIISLVGVLMGTKGHQLLSYHRFRSAPQTFLLDLHRFQIISMTRGCDIQCKIVEKGSSCYVEWVSDSVLPVEAKALSYELKGVKKLFWQGQPSKKVEFTLYSSGRLAPVGAITFCSEKEKQLFIDLTYPSYIKEGLGKKIVGLSPPLYPSRKKDG